MLHVGADAVWYLDKQLGLDLRWYACSPSNPCVDFSFCIAIHMAFDCMAIGVGLFASVMATWEPNESFTYG